MVSKGKNSAASASKKRLDWAKYTDYRARRSKEDLEKLCKGLPRSSLQEVFSSPDKVGLLPIHWAAIHNRADFIDFMVDNGSALRAKCKNKLFADGTALHLAAMNGSIEAVSMLLSKCAALTQGQQSSQTKPKILLSAVESEPQFSASNRQPTKEEQSHESRWLRERDAEGQTALMRSAAPRSRRLDRVRDLLRKNFWSLGGRPAEMALFLISKGADWLELDSKFGMNLMHWAVVNNYDDIVSMLLVLDRQLLFIPARFQDVTNLKEQLRRETTKIPNNLFNIKNDDRFETVDYDSSRSSRASSLSSDQTSSAGSSTQEPLVSKKERANELLSAGLMPLQLAIIYGRLKIISLLWHETRQGDNQSSFMNIFINSGQALSPSPAEKSRVGSEAELRAILLKVCSSNKGELANSIRVGFLKLILALDLTLLALVWIPVYLVNNNEDRGVKFSIRSGVFIVSFCISLALAFKVMLKSPGYLQQNSAQYFNELSLIVSDRVAPLSLPPTRTTKNMAQQQQQQASGARNGQRNVKERVRLLCHRCRCIRSSRSRHCNYCNHCVQDFDHHCIYLGCCVGRENRLDFLFLMVMVALTAIYGTVLYLNSLARNDWREFWHFIGLIWVVKYVLIGGTSAFLILRRACLGITMYEEIRAKRMRNLFGPSRYLNARKGSKSFWRDSPDRFLTGDLPISKIMSNLKEFANSNSLADLVISWFWPTDATDRASM